MISPPHTPGKKRRPYFLCIHVYFLHSAASCGRRPNNGERIRAIKCITYTGDGRGHSIKTWKGLHSGCIATEQSLADVTDIAKHRAYLFATDSVLRRHSLAITHVRMLLWCFSVLQNKMW